MGPEAHAIRDTYSKLYPLLQADVPANVSFQYLFARRMFPKREKIMFCSKGMLKRHILEILNSFLFKVPFFPPEYVFQSNFYNDI